MTAGELAPFDPVHMCSGCGSEGAQPTYHDQAIFLVFGRAQQWPCAGAGVIGQHLCLRCGECGHAWTETTAPPALPQA